VRQADHAGHHVVADLDLDVDRLCAARDPGAAAVAQAEPAGVDRADQRRAAEPALGQFLLTCCVITPDGNRFALGALIEPSCSGVRLVYFVMLATLDIPEQVMSALGTDPASAAVKIRLLAAMKLYELGRVSSGAAAALAGIARVEFLAQLGEYGVSPFQLSPADLEQDLENARRATRKG
jgi:predicted HTH domain antitoxin